jgi:hypothetical protein
MRAAFEGEVVHATIDYGRWPGAVPSAIRMILPSRLLERHHGHPLADRPAGLTVAATFMPSPGTLAATVVPHRLTRRPSHADPHGARAQLPEFIGRSSGGLTGRPGGLVDG